MAGYSVTSSLSAIYRAQQDLPAMFAEYLTDWMEGSTHLTVLVAGRTGTGKSTLINNLLKLSGRSKAPVNDKLEATTTQSKCYQNNIGGVQVIMWDTPGQPKNGLRDIKSDEVDLILFCVNMSAMKYAETEHEQVIHQYSTDLRIDMWKRTMFVLTFADKYISRVIKGCRNISETETTRRLESQVELWKKLLQSTLAKVETRLAPATVEKIKAIPYYGNEVHGHSGNELWREAVSATKLAARPAVLKIHQSEVGIRREGSSECNSKCQIVTLQLNENFTVSPVEVDIDSKG